MNARSNENVMPFSRCHLGVNQNFPASYRPSVNSFVQPADPKVLHIIVRVQAVCMTAFISLIPLALRFLFSPLYTNRCFCHQIVLSINIATGIVTPN